jgi:hypothetical protein
MTDEELRTCFAMFAMLKMAWHRGEEADDAHDCWFIADAMLKAKPREEDEGIAAIKKRPSRRRADVS